MPRVLCIDDQTYVRGATCAALKSGGVDVAVAESARSGSRAI